MAIALGLHVVGVVDDDPTKQGSVKGGLVVAEPDAIKRASARRRPDHDLRPR